MKLSSVLRARQQFNKINWDTIENSVDECLHHYFLVKQAKDDYTPDWAELDHALVVLKNHLELPVEHVLKQYQQQFDKLEKQYLKQSYRNFVTIKDDYKSIIELQIQEPDLDLEQEIASKIGQYTNWDIPALEIGPGTGMWTRYLIDGDPLYLVEKHSEFLDLTKQKFNEEYQRRLRCYTTDRTNLDFLPQQQIGFAFAWNVFEFMPYEVIKEYLISVFDVLHPGASFLFSYNNCELVGSCQLVEASYRCYMTEERMRILAYGLGYDIDFAKNYDSKTSYMVISKPGSLPKLRAGQFLAKISDK